MKNEKSTFVPIGDVAQRVLERVKRTMDASKWQHYQVPATKADLALTRRMCGEREDE